VPAQDQISLENTAPDRPGGGERRHVPEFRPQRVKGSRRRVDFLIARRLEWLAAV
jgi:hypothetical protein